ncbi:phosphoribosylamine--glycine ligase [Mollisia scopiformis]|uniref:Phosphoribosylamine--glycine ligase n=1 Tax=Mollisia scopiformis TaxID=149040 RepID=A0A194XI61_MOLSC|nr:phosphoribosylamine--glycine ligase [Mollisia scopiformis]KUJ19814.1 phosphoribosylamine--glycine ligase [Mollisia scopiformis]
MESIRILLVGNGGREHTLAWKLSQSPLVESIIAVPGNGGTATCPKTTNDTTGLKQDDYPGLVALAQKHKINLVVPGPEVPLVDGIEGYFKAVGIRCYGPSKLAARMEGSKTFSKDFMKKYNIPTAAYENFSSYDDAKKYLYTINHNVVIKASGLAAGKGVIIPSTKEDAHAALKDIMLDREFGSAGDEVVIEEFLEGDELSILSFSDGYTIRSLPPAQDHKRIFDGDQGPNTGGMGCYAPTNIASKELINEVEKTILQPTIDGMRHDQMRFVGTLFTGLMITKNGPKVLEYNVRFGDPETQTLLPLMSEDSDLAKIMIACTDSYLDSPSVTFKVDAKSSATVVVAAGGYPGKYTKGIPMSVTTPPTDTNIFHAGTSIVEGQLQTSGGRVIASQATAENLENAVKKAYTGVECIKFTDMFFRKDIAHRAFKPPAATREALTYAAAGVSIEDGNNFVEEIKREVASTRRPGALAIIGGFGGELDLAEAGYSNGGILVGAIDGVGTKLMIAQTMTKHDTVGIDLVAMNVNDLLANGAEPLMFLDYYGCSKLNTANAVAFVKGVAAGCRLSHGALVGGETAEMPGMYQQEDYDAAGCSVGIMLKENRLPKKDSMVEEDIILGLASDGVHSNGFSLVRRIIERARISYHDPAPWNKETSTGLSLLTPTRIYVAAVLPLIKKRLILGLAHITGGGLTENIPRALPEHLAAEIDVSTWQVPPVFKYLKENGNVSGVEMAKTFNNGVGMVAVVSKDNAQQVVSELEAAGEKVYTIGKLVPRSAEGCILKNLQTWD